MKDKDRWFYEAFDTLKRANVNPMAAAHMWDYQLLALKGFTRQHLVGWRRWFYHESRKLESGIGAVESSDVASISRTPDSHNR